MQVKVESSLGQLLENLEHTPETGESIESILEEIANHSEADLLDLCIVLRKAQTKNTLEKAYERIIALKKVDKELINQQRKMNDNINDSYFEALIKAIEE